MITSKEIKPLLIKELIYFKGYHSAFTEVSLFFGIADVFSLTKNSYTHEFEIKTSRDDLRTELVCIDIALNKKEHKKYHSKLRKHCSYLTKLTIPSYTLFDKNKDIEYLKVDTDNIPNKFSIEYLKVDTDNIPNKFSFVVIPELKDYALDHIKNTPYGLYTIERGSLNLKIIKKADFLHKDKISEKQIFKLLRKASTEVEVTRSALNKIKNI